MFHFDRDIKPYSYLFNKFVNHCLRSWWESKKKVVPQKWNHPEKGGIKHKNGPSVLYNAKP
jgi:hypothetical protein